MSHRALPLHLQDNGGREADKTCSVVLMDELDQLLTAKQDVVYNFFNWPAMRDSQLFVIAVANRMDLPQHLAAKIKSRLGESRHPALACEYSFRYDLADSSIKVYRRSCSNPTIVRILSKLFNPDLSPTPPLRLRITRSSSPMLSH